MDHGLYRTRQTHSSGALFHVSANIGSGRIVIIELLEISFAPSARMRDFCTLMMNVLTKTRYQMT